MSTQISNFLQTNNFELVIPTFETVRFLSTSVNIPSVELPAATADSPFSRMNFAGDKVSFSPLEFQFTVDEGMQNYYEIFNWIISIGYTENFKQYPSYPNKDNINKLGEQDIKIVVLNSKNNPTATFTFVKAIPVSLSAMKPLDTAVGDVEYMTATVTFVYDYYDMVLESA